MLEWIDKVIQALLPQIDDDQRNLVWKLAISAALVCFVFYAEGIIEGSGYATKSDLAELSTNIDDVQADMNTVSGQVLNLRSEIVRSRIFDISAELCIIERSDNPNSAHILQQELADLSHRHWIMTGNHYELKLCD